MFTEQVTPLLRHPTTAAARPFDNAVRPLDYAAGLRLHGLDGDDVRGQLVVDRLVELTSATGSALSPLFRLLSTPDIDCYKEWIGVPDAAIRAGLAAPPLRRPSGSPPRLDAGWNTATPEALEDLDLAATWYLFGDSSEVADYRPLLAPRFAPYEAALHVFERVEIFPGGTLAVQGHPAILLLDELVIHPGGALTLFTPARVLVRRLTRLPG